MASPSRCLLQALSWALARSPDFVGASLCSALGALVYTFSSRRHDILSALDHAFPQKTQEWKNRICRLHCTRMFEMFLIVLAMRHWSEREMRDRVRMSPCAEAFFDGPAKKRPSVLFLTHASTTEALAVVPTIKEGFPSSMTLYRALDHPVADAFVKESREFAGNKLHSRRDGLLKAKKALQTGSHTVGILFDQSAGFNGHLGLLFGRLCTTSNLAAMLATKTKAASALVYVRRDGFWRGTVIAHPLPESSTPDALLRAANTELEKLLSESDSQCADWFWAHKRWKATIRKETILNLERLKSYLPQEMQTLGLAELPRCTRFVLRLDPRRELLSFAGKVADFIRLKRPDALIWLLAPAALPPAELPLHDESFVLPQNKQERVTILKRLNAERYPDALISLDPSPAAVAEAKLLQCDFRGGFSTTAPARRTFHAYLAVEPSSYLNSPYTAMTEFLEKLGLAREDTEPHFQPPHPKP